MRRFVVILIFALLLNGCSSCRHAANTEANNANSEESPFAYITDANTAMAEGDRLFDENQTEMAIEAYRQAIKLNPDLADAHFKLGIAYALLEMQMQQSGDVTDSNI